MNDRPTLSVVMPCLNEEQTLELCIKKARSFIERSGLQAEIIIADNGSQDRSLEIASLAGAKVVSEPKRGYGAAIMAGVVAAKGTYVVMGDADDSYDFSSLDQFMGALDRGADLVVGNRFSGGISPGAMPWHHRYIGNPVLSFVGRLFFSSNIGDFHCGLRAFRRDKILALGLTSPGMEFASEMIVRSTLADLRIVEVPTTLKKDGRSRPPHLKSFRDGWRHLRFLLLHSPTWLFLYPGMLLFALGWITQALLATNRISIGRINFDIHTLLYSGAASIVGTQLIVYALLAHVAAYSNRLLPKQPSWVKRLSNTSLEALLIVWLAMILVGVVLAASAINFWAQTGFSELNPVDVMRKTIPSVTLIVCGVELAFASFLLYLLKGAR